MRDSRSHLPLPYKITNALGRVLVAARLPSLRLDERSVCAAAKRRTGLSDFGDPHYRQGLLRLLQAAEQDANLHPLGRYMTNQLITDYLVQRLRLVETRKKEPEIFEKPLLPPLLITGAARSGTTFLHNLLALDPAHRALPQWLLFRPFPERPRNGDGPDPRIGKAEQSLRLRGPLHPDLDAIHHSRPDSPEECILLLGLTFHSLIFGTLLPVYGYTEWYLAQEDTAQKYREYRWLLQVFQAHEPEQRLALKAPAHLGNLEPLLQAVPELLVIQTHREPVACISSVCSLLYTFHLVVADEIDLHRMADLTLQVYEAWFRRNLAFRAAHPDVIYDLEYDALVSDPVGTVQGIYAHLNLPWTDAHAIALEEYVQRNPKGKYGQHHYAASDYGLTEAGIAERLGFYSEQLGR